MLGLLWSVGFLSCFCRGFHRVLRFLLSMECWSSLEWLVFTESEGFLLWLWYGVSFFIECRGFHTVSDFRAFIV